MEDFMLDYRNAAIKILCDFENVPLSRTNRGGSLPRIYHKMKVSLAKANMNGAVSMKVFSQSDTFPNGLDEQLINAANGIQNFEVEVKLVDRMDINIEKTDGSVVSARRKEMADVAIINTATYFMGKIFENRPLNIVLISGDQDFSKLVAEMKLCGFNTMVVVTEKEILKGGLLGQNADAIWQFEDFINGEEPLYKKRTLAERSEEQPFIGCLSRMINIVELLQEERIACSEDIIRMCYLKERSNIQFDRYLVLAVTIGKVVVEKDTKILNKLKQGGSVVHAPATNFYRLAGTNSSTVDVSLPAAPCANDYNEDVWDEIGKEIISNEILQTELRQPETSLYVAAPALRQLYG